MGTAEHDDPAGMTRDAWGRLLPQSAPAAGSGCAGGAASAVELPGPPKAPVTWTPEQDAGFARFYRRYAGAFFLFARGELPNRCDAEDAVNSAFSYMLQHWPRLATTENPGAYAWKVLKSKIADQRRAARRFVPVDDAQLLELRDQPPGGDPGTELVNLMALQAVIRSFPERLQEALVLEQLGVPLREVAELMGIKEESARMNLKRARARLKRALEAPSGRGLQW
ncbi:sigma-70 family RNA polymerase sigma factor [Streptomyces sp. NRRL S-241]|uniref:sigma-70 family RNA polymerase sigma factor n=1 Tax=Streptomyces sp. NRRL S-241 TaxID=1463896 RepID=UPI00068C7313|nr:sigma-70 family RNA polymerase sigma factor [Streptomyces sp. NRRL S-241]